MARVRTLTVLQRLDASRKYSVPLFLHESCLIDKGKCIVELDIANLLIYEPTVELYGEEI